ncbi:hypothetical protein HK096_005883, partial [Nowakowskiella sp. JEL0078]
MSVYRMIYVFSSGPSYQYAELFSTALTFFNLSEFGLNLRVLYKTSAGSTNQKSGGNTSVKSTKGSTFNQFNDSNSENEFSNQYPMSPLSPFEKPRSSVFPSSTSSSNNTLLSQNAQQEPWISNPNFAYNIDYTKYFDALQKPADNSSLEYGFNSNQSIGINQGYNRKPSSDLTYEKSGFDPLGERSNRIT